MKDLDISYLVTKLLNKKVPILIHGERVAKLACAIAKIMKYTDEEIRITYHASVVHDIGKLRLPSEIINKPGKLSEDEIIIVRKHPELGCSLLMQITSSESIIAKAVLQHHERLNGSGYPFGLHGEDIAHIAKIIAVADVIDTMVSPQVYRPALSIDEALQEVKQNSGLLYDFKVVAASLKCVKK